MTTNKLNKNKITNHEQNPPLKNQYKNKNKTQKNKIQQTYINT